MQGSVRREIKELRCAVVCGPVCDPALAGLTRNSPGDEIANVNFLYDDIVHALKIQ